MAWKIALSSKVQNARHVSKRYERKLFTFKLKGIKRNIAVHTGLRHRGLRQQMKDWMKDLSFLFPSAMASCYSSPKQALNVSFFPFCIFFCSENVYNWFLTIQTCVEWGAVLDSLPERNGMKGDQIFQNYMN